MWIFDFLKPSYNFARHIKFLLEQVWVEMSEKHILTWEELYLLYMNIIKMNTLRLNLIPNQNYKILQIIIEYLFAKYSYDTHKFKELTEEELINFITNRFNSLRFWILEFTQNIMIYSIIKEWLNLDFYNEKDSEIVERVLNLKK